MDIEEEILKEHSKPHALKVAAYACSSLKHFKQLMKCFMSDDYRLAQRAAWSVSWAAIQKPSMIIPHVKDLVAVLERKDAHPAVIRNAVRVLQLIEIPRKFHGQVMNACFNFIETPSTPIAIKAFSLTTLANLSNVYPEIKHELKLIIEENWHHESPAFKSRGRKILAQLAKNQ